MRNIEEPQARTILAVACMVGLLAGVLSIALGLNGNRSTALLALVIAVAGAITAWIAYRRYRVLRESRWHDELAESKQQLDELFSEAASSTTEIENPQLQTNSSIEENTDIAKR